MSVGLVVVSVSQLPDAVEELGSGVADVEEAAVRAGRHTLAYAGFAERLSIGAAAAAAAAENDDIVIEIPL